MDIANESFIIGEKISETKLVQKVMRSLPQRFIEEANDIATLKLNELFGSLRTFELRLSDNDSRKGKGVTLHSMGEEDIQ